MELKKTIGCVAFSLSVDGVEEINLTDEERQEVLNKIFNKLKPDDLNYVLQALIPIFGEYESDGIPCECCGDIVEEYTWKI